MTEFQADRRRLIGAGVFVAGVGAIAACSSGAKSEAAAASGWQPTMDQMDSWLDKAGTQHRVMYDAVSGEGGGEALGFANNFIKENEFAYGLKPEQLGVVVVLRHMATPYAYNNAMWAKYGKGMAGKMGLKDEMATRAATANPLLAAAAPGPALPPGFEWFGDSNLTALGSKGVRFAACGLATEVIGGMLAQAAGGDAKAIADELKANLIPGAVIVPAGVVGVNRAQEHGYSYTYVG